MAWQKNGEDANPSLSSLRVIPWWTDTCVDFIIGVLKWLPNYYRRPIRILELGSGNSTLFFLSKGCHVRSYKSDSKWAAQISTIYTTWFTSANVGSSNAQDPDLILVEYAPTILPNCFSHNIATSDIIIIDADPRDIGLKTAIDFMTTMQLLVIDNWNFQCYSEIQKSKIIHDPSLTIMHFQQQNGPFRHCVKDKFGWEAPHEWVSSIVIHNDSIFNRCHITTRGLPQKPLGDHPSILDNTYNLFDQKYL